MEKKPCYLLELPKHRFRSIFTSGVCSALIKEHGMNTCSHDIRLSTSEVIRTEYDNARRLTREDDTLMLLISCNFLGTNDGLPPFDEITRFVELPHTLSIIIFPTEEKETEHKEWEYQFLKHLQKA